MYSLIEIDMLSTAPAKVIRLYQFHEDALEIINDLRKRRQKGDRIVHAIRKEE